VLAISPATADRLLQPLRQKDSPRGLGTTRVGRLLKHQIPIRTFNEWNETRPGFLEADLVAHCGWTVEGLFLHTLVLTDVASGWTECLALLHRSQAAVVQALDRAQVLLPIPMLGLDTDNGSEFINVELLAYCERARLTFTRGRAYRKNDQCYVEQKNGAIVRQFVGYDRFESERAYRQLTELYRAVRLYVTFFQPSMKLLTKQRDQGKVHRKYDPARTPLQRLLAADVLTAETRTRLETIYLSLDPLALLKQIATLQDALWQLAVFEPPAVMPADAAPASTDVRFQVEACRPITAANQIGASESAPAAALAESTEQRRKRKYHRTLKPRAPHWWRTRADPFEAVWEELRQWLAVHPERTAKAALLELQARYPGQFPDAQLRTLQRRVQAWRAQVMFDDQWLQEETLAGQTFPRPLLAVEDAEPSMPRAISVISPTGSRVAACG
jgi:hypothetical protein